MAFEEYSDDVRNASLKAALSGGLSGAIFGAGARALSGSKAATLKELLKAAGIGAATAGGIAGGSTFVGSSLAGAPEEDDPSGYTKRGALGGGITGGIVGAGLGALAAKGKIGIPAKSPAFLKTYFANLKSSPHALLKGAGVGALAGGLPAAHFAADEGMQLDFIKNEMMDKKRREYALLKQRMQEIDPDGTL